MCTNNAGTAPINKSQNELPEKKSKLQESHNHSEELVQPKSVGNKGNRAGKVRVPML